MPNYFEFSEKANEFMKNELQDQKVSDKHLLQKKRWLGTKIQRKDE